VYSFYGFDNNNRYTLSNMELGFSGQDNTWRNIWLCFDLSWVSAVSDTLLFRFSMLTDSANGVMEGWMIDNMMASQTIIHTVNETETQEYMQVYPNPTPGKFEIETKKINAFHIIEDLEVRDSHGRVVQQFRNCPTKFSIDLSGYPTGVYFVKAKTNVKTETFQVTVQR